MSEQRKAELQSVINQAYTELHAINNAEAMRANADRVGHYYKYLNSYSCPQSPADYWWIYFNVTGLSGTYMEVVEFETDSHGEIRINLKTERRPLDGWQEISADEYQAAWDELIQRLTEAQWVSRPKPMAAFAAPREEFGHLDWNVEGRES